ncbi:MAG: mannose-1-phosphate guanylyltransferase [Marmoricola sp.]
MPSVSDPLDRFWAVIPAGGAGTRLWPLSRAGRPKFLLDLTGSGRSLLQETVTRLEPLVGDRVLVVTGARHAAQVRAQLPQLDVSQVLAEPSPRDSMPAIGLAAAVLERRDPGALLGSFAADHVIDDPAAFAACVREAVGVADTGRIVTLGITPTHPATGFGYIEVGEPVGGGAARAVRSFVEKPDADRAARYVAAGTHLWNAGMFVSRAGVLLDELARTHPDLAAGVRGIAADPGTLEAAWPGLTRIAIDHAVAEPAAARGVVATVPAPFGWDDVGDFASLQGLLGGRPGELRVLGDGEVLGLDSSGMVVTGDRPVAVLGLRDVVVVDTPDGLLVTDLAHAQEVKRVVEELRSRGLDDLT